LGRAGCWSSRGLHPGPPPSGLPEMAACLGRVDHHDPGLAQPLLTPVRSLVTSSREFGAMSEIDRLSRRELEPFLNTGHPHTVRHTSVERVTIVVVSGALTIGVLVAFVVTQNPWVLPLALILPFAFPFAHALGLAMVERVAPLAIDTVVNELVAEFQKEPELSLGLGDRIMVWRGHRRTTKKRPEPAVVLVGVPEKAEYIVKLANGDIETIARKFIVRREDYDRVAEVLGRPVT
jgi:hypothetical protein